jgi:hypothetical protein
MFARCLTLLLVLGCSGQRHPSAQPPAARPATLPEPAVPPPTTRRAVEHEQLLAVGETSPVLGAIQFDQQAFLQLRSGWAAIDGTQLTFTTSYLSGLEPPDFVQAGAGKFPESAWLLVLRDGRSVPPLRWHDSRWEPTHADDPAAQPHIYADLCRWGERHLALRVELDAQASPTGSFFELLDGEQPPPEFTASESKTACITRVLAESCWPLSGGGLVVIGAACGAARGASRQAVEYFAPNARVGVPVELPRHDEMVVSSVSRGGAHVYLAGRFGAKWSALLLNISEQGRVEELEVPAYVDAIERVAADEDGSVWVRAPLRERKLNFDGDGLWRRSPLGSWTPVAVESRMPGRPEWSVNIFGYGLFSAAGNVWLEASYLNQRAAKGEESGTTFLYRNRETLAAGSLVQPR